MTEIKKENTNTKKVILCEDKEQRSQNVKAFVRNFKKNHKVLMDRLAA